MKTTILIAILFICAQLAAQDSTTYKIYLQHQSIAAGIELQLVTEYRLLKTHSGADAKTLENDIKTMQQFYVIVKTEIDTINKLPPVYLDMERNARATLYQLMDLVATFYNSSHAQLQSNYTAYQTAQNYKKAADIIKPVWDAFVESNPLIKLFLQNNK